MNADAYISPAHALIHNGIAVFSALRDLDGFTTPYKLRMTLLAVCVKGAISASIDLETRRMNAGSIMVLRPGHVINGITATEDYDGFFILIKEEKFSEIIPMASGSVVSCMLFFAGDPIVNIAPSEVHNLELIYALLRQKTLTMNLPYNALAFNSLCEVLFYETIGIYTSRMRATAVSVAPTRREELLSRFMALVDENFRHERSVKFYADALCLSPKHLSAVVKQTTGMPAGDWLARKVVREAKFLLRSSPKTIQQISAELRFPNQSFFGKFFKSKTGVTPRQYRAGGGAES